MVRRLLYQAREKIINSKLARLIHALGFQDFRVGRDFFFNKVFPYSVYDQMYFVMTSKQANTTNKTKILLFI